MNIVKEIKDRDYTRQWKLCPECKRINAIKYHWRHEIYDVKLFGCGHTLTQQIMLEMPDENHPNY